MNTSITYSGSEILLPSHMVKHKGASWVHALELNMVILQYCSHCPRISMPFYLRISIIIRCRLLYIKLIKNTSDGE